MDMNSLALPTLGLLAALATPVLAAPFAESAWSAGGAVPHVSDSQFVVAPEATGPWFNGQFGSNDYNSTSALNETDAVLATYVAGLTIDSIHNDRNGYDFSDAASLVIANNGLSSNLFGIPPTAGWSGFGLTDSFRREIERKPEPQGAGADSPSLFRFSWYREITEVLQQLTSRSTT